MEAGFALIRGTSRPFALNCERGLVLEDKPTLAMSSLRPAQPCQWHCQWKGTGMCSQCLLSSQALADHRVTLGVLCGLRHLYHPHGLPPCIVGDVVDWSGPRAADAEVFAA
jgi:hypothetical protein